MKAELHKMLKVPRPVGDEVQPCLASGVAIVSFAEKVALMFAAVTPFTKPFLKMSGDNNNIKRAAKMGIFVVH